MRGWVEWKRIIPLAEGFLLLAALGGHALAIVAWVAGSGLKLLGPAEYVALTVIWGALVILLSVHLCLILTLSNRFHRIGKRIFHLSNVIMNNTNDTHKYQNLYDLIQDLRALNIPLPEMRSDSIATANFLLKLADIAATKDIKGARIIMSEEKS